MRPLATQDRETLAAHKFHQRQIMGKAARRKLIVQYYQWGWTFLDPETHQALSPASLTDDEAINWLDSHGKLKSVN